MRTSLFFASVMLVVGSAFTSSPLLIQTSQFPPKTIFIKDPGAEDLKTFFSTSTNYQLYVYKVGTKDDITQILNTFGKSAEVERITEGAPTGDYQAFSIQLKKVQNKDWFRSMFLKAKLNTIRVNNNPVLQVNKL